MRSLHIAPDGTLADRGLAGEPRLQRLLEVLNPAGEETRLVGGAVRNALIGLPAGDIDLATTLPPAGVVERAGSARLRTIPTGIAHGTVTVLVAGQPFEVTTLREDIETDGRHAVVRFGRDFAADARRRDFTVNALSADRHGRLYDTTGGLEDLARGRIRFIGDPAMRIREDYLRILRFFRFHATYGEGGLDATGLAACAEARDGLLRLSRERVRSEFLKLLAARGAAAVLSAMEEAAILDRVLGGPADVRRVSALVAFDAGGPALPRLAALAARSREDVDRLRERLRLSNAETSQLLGIVAALDDFAAAADRPPRTGALRAALFQHGRPVTTDALRIWRASEAPPADPPPWDAAARFLAETPEPVLPMSGGDLLARGISGPAIGAILARLRQAWSRAGCPEDRDEIASMLEQAIDATAPPSGPQSPA